MKGDIKMKYISAEQLLKQSDKVQRVLLDWWKPSVGDLCWYKESKFVSMIDIDYNIEDIATKNLILFFKIPLFTEGQLREFIEDNCLKIEINTYGDGEYTLKTFLHGRKNNMVDCDYLLQAYWQVACTIAEEEL